MKDLLHPSKWKDTLFTPEEMCVKLEKYEPWKEFHKFLSSSEALW